MAYLYGMVGRWKAMKYWVLLRSNIRKQKGSYIAILLLMLIISLTLSSVLTLWCNSERYLQSEMDRLNFGDVIYWIYDMPDFEDLEQDIRDLPDTSGVVSAQFIAASGSLNAKAMSYLFIRAYDAESTPFRLFDENSGEYAKASEPLRDGEAYVPVSFRSIYDAVIGDIFCLNMADGTEVSYVIRGFFEDPTAGSSMMGMKNLFVNSSDFEQIHGKAFPLVENSSPEDAALGYTIHIFQNPKSSLTHKELQRNINENTAINSYMGMAHSRETILGFMLILQKIFIAFLVTFAAVLVVVALIVISHSITSGIEQDYVNLGILKALGFTGGHLRIAQCLFYMTALGIGMLSGTLASRPLVSILGNILLPVMGILPSSQLPMTEILLLFGAILALLFLFLLARTGKIGRIKPIVAIRNGSEDIFWNGHFQPQLHGKCLQFWLAVRQIFSGKKHYIGVCFVTALLVLFLSLCGRIQSWIGEDGGGLKTAMSMASVEGKTYDFAVLYPDETIRSEAEQLLSDRTKLLANYQSLSVSAKLNDMDYLMNVISNTEYFHILEGRTCKYDNEIVITETVASEMSLNIGDTVTVSSGSGSADYIITGINQCANDMGANFSMGQNGYTRISDETSRFYQNYVLEDNSLKETLIQELRTRYGDNVKIDENNWSGIDGIVSASRALNLVMYVISMIFSLIVVYMTGSRILFQEQHDLGIYKALGFLSSRLRLSFAIRFALVSGIGALLGIVLSIYLTDPIVSRVFLLFGVSSFHSGLDTVSMLLPAVFVVVIFFLCAYLVSARMKNTDPGVLISE